MEPTQRPLLAQALGLAWELGYSIAVPLVLFALLGRWADQAWGTSPWGLLSGVLLSIVLTSFLLVRKFSQLVHDIEPPTTK